MTILSLFASTRTTLILIVLATVMGMVLYGIGIAIDAREARLAVLNGEIARSHDQLSVLKADWAYLSRPDRILFLGTDLLGLAPLTPQQIVPADQLHYLWATGEASE